MFYIHLHPKKTVHELVLCLISTVLRSLWYTIVFFCMKLNCSHLIHNVCHFLNCSQLAIPFTFSILCFQELGTEYRQIVYPLFLNVILNLLYLLTFTFFCSGNFWSLIDWSSSYFIFCLQNFQVTFSKTQLNRNKEITWL